MQTCEKGSNIEGSEGLLKESLTRHEIWKCGFGKFNRE